MQKLFFPISVIILCYLVYYHSIWFISFEVVEEDKFAFFTTYFPMARQVNMIELRVINLLLALLSGLTFTLALTRSRTGATAFVNFLLVINVIVILLGIWQVAVN